MSELAKRVIVAVVGIPVALFVIYIGGFIFFFTLLLLANFVLWEFYQMAQKKNLNPLTYTGLILSTLIYTLYFLLLQRSFDVNKNFLLIALPLIAFGLPSLLLFFQVFSKNKDTAINVAYTILGVFWVFFSFSSLLSIRLLPEFLVFIESLGIGKSELFQNISIDNNWAAKFFVVILGTIWLCDTFAYFFGTAYGKHKLAPKISPKKSWEGAAAGFVGAIISFYILDFVFSLNLQIRYQLLFASIVGIIGQIGDLAESKIKREFNIKDSSKILPGHGGFMDRLDSIMFVYPAALIALLLL
jgi:phosphatidate cytidylyltransferase